MNVIELEKSYDPASFEDRIYNLWIESGSFLPRDGKTFTIVIPPPNVTGILHIGHALNITLQDIEVRFHRMRGEASLWVPGTDHAGIATQNVVEKKLRAAGQSRLELGREKFVSETWKVKEAHHEIITNQIKKMGASVDWSRERFTLDEGLSKAVREVFVTLYERGLIYKGEYLVNWCTSCGTALADDEVEHNDINGKMYHIRYPVCGGGFVEIATTRPETLLGDTAIAVHPDDERYKELVGKSVKLPLTDREIPVVADTYVDSSFGTGVVKITPAHDPNDRELGKRHNLAVINIITPDGKLNDAAGAKYKGLSLKDARRVVVEDLKAGDFFIKEEDIKHSVGHCYRCNTVIEPYLSEQWFVKMKPLAEKALEAWQKGEIVFYPKKWENTYKHWLLNIRDWCISRQLWWGHRIPSWTCNSCGKITVSRTDIDKCPHCGGETVQDSDVLDTWFSSWLWPFSTLGWPDTNAADFKRFYPTTALITAYDIIFFWVSRMIMAGLEFTGKVPFRDIYIHGLVRDKQGRKMSKSLGNGIDPLLLVNEYGADAIKFTLAFLCAAGQDILVDKESFKLGSKFANKIWNASRYILMNLEGRSFVKDPVLLPVDRWIYSRLESAAKIMIEAFESYRYNEAASAAYEYFWNDFCDWYVEATKLSTKSEEDGEKDRAVTVLLDVLSISLSLLHPLLPFVTEEIYGKLPEECKKNKMLITSQYPKGKNIDAKIESEFGFLQEIVRGIRTLRSECTVPPDKKLRVVVAIEDSLNIKILEGNTALIKLLAGLSDLSISSGASEKGAIGVAGKGFEAFVFIAEAVDINLLKQKWTKDAEKDSKFILSIESKLSNENFIKNAPSELVMQEKEKLETAKIRVKKINSYLGLF